MADECNPRSPDDFAVCDATFARLLAANGGRLPPAGLEPPAAVVVYIWTTHGIIGNGGFDHLVEADLPGDQDYAKTVAAYDAVGCHEAANVLRQVVAIIGHEGLMAGASGRLRRLRRGDGKRRGELLQEFYRATRDLPTRLAAYIRAHEAELATGEATTYALTESEPELPSRGDEGPTYRSLLEPVPHRGRVRFAARIARRILPLFDQAWPEASALHRGGVLAAIELAERAGSGQKATESREVINGAIMAAGAAYIAMTGMPYPTDEDEKPDPLPRDGNAAAVAMHAAKTAEYAARAALEGKDNSISNAISTIIAAQAAAESAGQSLDDEIDRELRRARRSDHTRNAADRPWWKFW